MKSRNVIFLWVLHGVCSLTKSQGSQCPGQGSDWGSPEYKSRMVLLDQPAW